VHELAPALLHLPAAHAVQLPAPAALYVPAAQVPQALLPAAAYLPAVHCVRVPPVQA